MTLTKQNMTLCSHTGCGKMLREDYVYLRGDKPYCLTHSMVGITGRILAMQCGHEITTRLFGDDEVCTYCGDTV